MFEIFYVFFLILYNCLIISLWISSKIKIIFIHVIKKKQNNVCETESARYFFFFLQINRLFAKSVML